MKYVRDAIQEPLESLLDSCEGARGHAPPNVADLLGLIVRNVDVTVRQAGTSWFDRSPTAHAAVGRFGSATCRPTGT